MSDGPHSVPPEASASADFAFGPYRLIGDRRALLRGESTIRLGGRAFDLLLALLERAGEVITRRELEMRVWPHLVVEATSLRVQVSALRRAIGDGTQGARYIENVPGRGYCFVAPVSRRGPAQHKPVARPGSD